MDAVKAFNAELSSLYEVKPPISKAKMTAITRGAIKAIKFYKHVVQSVEKFILKCKPEYKVPGLYVIDSIVRQSRHQFGTDKDVFAPRFAKNMPQTFINLFACPNEDKSKIIRVLNLWQKNQVFAPEVIQPLFDLADPNNPIHKELQAQANAANNTPLQSNGMNLSTVAVKGSPALQKTPTKGTQQGIDGAHLGGTNLNLTDQNVLAQLQQLQKLLTRSGGGDTSAKSDGQPVHFDRKLLDFDYGDDDDDGAHSSPKPPSGQGPNDSVASLLTNPEVLRQLQTIQQTMNVVPVNELLDIDKIRKLQEMQQQEDAFDKHLAQTVPNLPFAAECEFKPSNSVGMMVGGYYMMPPGTDMSQPPPGYKPQGFDINPPQDDVQFVGPEADNGVDDVEVINLDHSNSRSPSPHEDRYSRRRRSRSRERSRDRRDRDRRSRRSRSRSKTRRHRSRSRDRTRGKEKEKEKEKETEKDKERKKRGLPVMKKDNLSVCSTTLWVGHLSKLVHQEDLSNTFGEFGDIVSIDLIPPRGCAFIVMDRRQDAARCLAKLKNHNLHGKAITLAWAPGKGVKGKDLKDYWEGDLGVSYIPYHKLKPDIDIELLEDGGMIDEDTMPAWMKAKQQNQQGGGQQQPTMLMADVSGNFISIPTDAGAAGRVDTSQPPPVGNAGLLQPPPMALPLVSPFQFNNRLLSAVGLTTPGLLPPMGVPPPSMSGGAAAAAAAATVLMQNQLVGLGSPFQGAAAAAANLLPPQMPQNMDKGQSNTEMKSLSETLMSMASQPFMMQPQPPMGIHDDNMDVEMEDADKVTDGPRPLLSEQLQSLIFDSGQNGHRPNPGGLGSSDEPSRGRDRRDRDRRNSSRERDRDRNNRDRDRGGRFMGRDNPDFRDERGDRSRDRGGDRRGGGDRPNRWGEREHSVDKREREKTLNDRLLQMAGQAAGAFPPAGDPFPGDRPPRGGPPPGDAFPVDRPPRGGPPPGDHFPGDRPPRGGPPPGDPFPGDRPPRGGPPPGDHFSGDRPPRGGPPPGDPFPNDRPPRGGPPPGDPFPGDRPPRGGPPDRNSVGSDGGGPPPSLMDRRMFPPPHDGGPPPMDDMDDGPYMDMGGPPPMMDDYDPSMGGPPPMMDDYDQGMGGPPPMMDDYDPGMGGPPPMMDDYDPGMGGPPPMMDDYDPGMDGPPMMDDYGMMNMDHHPHHDFPPGGPPMRPGPGRMHHPMRDDFEQDRFMRGGPGPGRRGDFRDNFDPRNRGPPGPPGPDFFPGPGPRDGGFGPRGMMRGGPGPGDFPPQRPPLMRGPPGPPHNFHGPGPHGPGPRGPPMRGPRPNPPWKDRGGNFGPRFDHPGDFHRGPGGPPGMFDEPPHMGGRGHRGPPRFEDRTGPRGSRPDFTGPDGPPDGERFEKRGSRWGNTQDDDGSSKKQPSSLNDQEPITIEDDPPGEGGKGNTTPLRDEPFNRADEVHIIEDETPPPPSRSKEKTPPVAAAEPEAPPKEPAPPPPTAPTEEKPADVTAE